MPLSASRKRSGVASCCSPSSNQYFTASFMNEVNKVRNRHLKFERQSHCLGCAPIIASTSLEAAIDLYQGALAFCCH